VTRVLSAMKEWNCRTNPSGKMRNRTSTLRTDTISPTFRGLCLERFIALIESAEGLPALAQRELVLRELKWCESRPTDTVDFLKYRAILFVLRDLLGQGWETRYKHRSIYLSRPDYTRGKHRGLDAAVVKEQIRAAHRDERLSKINTPSSGRFIRSLEQPPDEKTIPILRLITSGADLARDLGRLTSNSSVDDAERVIKPYLQLVRADERDSLSRHKLTDIWRYFRYLWAIPFQPTPGRNLFYLVRDAARPYHPVIGIGALGNCVVQLSERDQAIGWSLEGIEQTLARRARTIERDLPKGSPVPKIKEVEFLETEDEHRRRIHRYAKTLASILPKSISAELALIKRTGLVSGTEQRNPTEAVIRRLLEVAGASEHERLKTLRAAHQRGESARAGKRKATFAEEAGSPLFVRKRAQAVADALFARMVFSEERFSKEPLPALLRMLQSDRGRKALRLALHSNKKTKIGSSMMDIIVCGAIPPYSELLGGKLVAMLMASPQVIRDYRQTYGHQPSEIVSKLAGARVVRPADLVFLTTTSLYHVGSSQYERIRVPGTGDRQIAFEYIGHTEGYGSIALSTECTDALRHLTTVANGFRRVNNIQGEGVSPRLRMTREGLAFIGIPQDLVLKHDCPRLIYGVRLATNAFEYLRGETSIPDYVLRPGRYREGTQAVVRHWVSRWLLPRARRKESLDKIRAMRPDDLLISQELGTDAHDTPSTPEDESQRPACVG
jgi:hypothetical protein